MGLSGGEGKATGIGIAPVSYTHLDVYKRQALYLIGNDGRNVQISSVRQVGTTKKNLVMVNAPSPEESRREIPVSYTHLDVYKRQVFPRASFMM